MKEIQELLGHSNYNFTADTYAHTDNSAKQAMIGTISADILGCL
ncbi:MAG: recombinase [Ruminococcus sp.]|nr:recombinase [Ruminococcus sp.]